MEVPENIRDAGPRAVAHYKRMIQNGASHLFAEMCSLQMPPGVKGTDRAVMQGRYDSSWLDEMPKAQAQRILREAKAAGIVTTGRYYMSGLADKRGHCDPKAWIDGAADIRRVAKERNLHVRGIVDYTPPEQPPPERPIISERLQKELIARERKKNPKLSKREAKELVIDRYAPNFKKKKT